MTARTFFGRCICLVLLAGGFPALAAEREPGDLRAAGKIDFPISASPEAQAEFVRGVALLHSFFYEEARRIFTDVAAQDPKCAMAQWGIAMTWWHPIWTPPTPDEMSAGRAAIDQAVALEAGSERERGFITALHTYYHAPDGPAAGRPSANRAMERSARAIGSSPTRKRSADWRRNIPTISRRRRSTPSRN